MDSQIGRAGFHIGFYIAFVSGILLLFLRRGTAEYLITLFTFGVALIFLLIIAVIVRWSQRKV
jgi:hypothetical protein